MVAWGYSKLLVAVGQIALSTQPVSISEIRQTLAGNTSGPAWSCHVARRHSRFWLVTSSLSCEGINASKKIPLNPETELISFIRGLQITSHQKTDHLFYSKKRTIAQGTQRTPPTSSSTSSKPPNQGWQCCVPKLCMHNVPSCNLSLKNPATKPTKARLSWYRTNTRPITAKEPLVLALEDLWSLALKNNQYVPMVLRNAPTTSIPTTKGLK